MCHLTSQTSVRPRDTAPKAFETVGARHRYAQTAESALDSATAHSTLNNPTSNIFGAGIVDLFCDLICTPETIDSHCVFI